MANNIKVWFYKNGNQCSNITGGWKACEFGKAPYDDGYTYKGSYYLEYGDNLATMSVSDPCIGKGGFTTANVVSLQNYKTLYYHHEIYSSSTTHSANVNIHIALNSTNTGSGTLTDLRTVTVVGNNTSNEESSISVQNKGYNQHLTVYGDCGSYSNDTVIGRLHYMYAEATNPAIKITSQNTTKLTFSLNNVGGHISYTKVDILSNGNVIKSYTSGIESTMTYDIVDSDMSYGYNTLSIQATYTQGNGINGTADLTSNTKYFREVVLDDFEQLPHLNIENTTMTNLISRLYEINEINNVIINNFVTLIQSKGIVIEGNIRMKNILNLIKEIIENGNTTSNEYLSRITNLEIEIQGLNDEIVDNKNKLFNILTEEGVSVTEEDDMASLISKVDEEFTKDNNTINSLNTTITLLNNQVNSLTSELAGKVTPAGTAVAANVLSGKTFINSTGQLVTGTMANRGGAQTVTPGTANKTLSAGYYSGNITVAGDADLVAANIVSGKNIFGVAGSAITGKRTTTGTYKIPGTGKVYSFTVSGLAFKPSSVVLKIDDTYWGSGNLIFICHSPTASFSIIGTDYGETMGENRTFIQSDITCNTNGFTCKVPGSSVPLHGGYTTVYYIAIE